MQQFLTWLWQGTMLAVGVWGLLRLLRPNAATRFAIWWATLLAVLTLLLVSPSATTPTLSSLAPEALPFRLTLTVPIVPSALLAIGIGAWLGLALLGLVHLGVSISHLQQLKLGCRPFPLARERRLSRWMRLRGTGRRTRLCVTEDVRSASVLGLGLDAAIIAINPSLLADLDDEELDLIVLHEYAHLQRRDDWLHVLQLGLHALLVVHPAMASIGRALRLEREAACDDWVLDQTPGAPDAQARTVYARSLTKVAAFELASPNDLIAAMGVVGRDGDLTRRIERILSPRRRTEVQFAAMPAASVAVVLVAATIGLSRLPPLVAISATTFAGAADTATATGAGTDTAAATAAATSATSASAAGGAAASATAAARADGAAGILPSTAAAAAVIASALDPLTRAASVIVMPERLAETEPPLTSLASAARAMSAAARAANAAAATAAALNARRGASRGRDVAANGVFATAATRGSVDAAGASGQAGVGMTASAAAADGSSAGSTDPATNGAARAPDVASAAGVAGTTGAAGHDGGTASLAQATPDAPELIASQVFAMASAPISAPVHRGDVASTAGGTTEAAPDAADAANARGSRGWQHAAGAGVSVVGQGAATVGVSVGQGAKRVGTATGGFVTRVASSIGKVLP